MGMKIYVVGIIVVSTLVLFSIALTPTTALQANSKGLKLYLTVDTNLNDDVRINTYVYGDRVFTHNADTGYNSEAKQPEHVFINLFVEENRNSPDVDVDGSQAQSQSNDNTNTNTNANSQSQTTIICPETRDCVIQR